VPDPAPGRRRHGAARGVPLRDLLDRRADRPRLHRLESLVAGALGRPALAADRGGGRHADASLALTARAMAGSVRLKDHWGEQRLFGRRIIAATVVILLLVGALFARLFYLQVVKHEYFSDLSQGNRIRIEPLPPSRGLIL